MENSGAAAGGWRGERDEMRKRISALTTQGKCFLCEDLESGGVVMGPQPVIYDDPQVRIVLDRFPRAKGHSVVILKQHREDLSDLSEGETAALFGAAVKATGALRGALGAERVYLVAINDPPASHVHLQLVPRYPKESAGPRRLVAERMPLVNANEVAERVRSAFEAGR